MPEPILEIKGLRKSYGKHTVLKDVNMQVNRGDIYGLIGKNGAGKTTLFKVILGLSEFEKGSLSLFGGKSRSENAARRRKIGFLVGNNFFDYLSGRDNLDYFRRMKGIRDKNEVDRVLKLVGLDKEAAHAKARGYSLGMKQRLGIANALLGSPELLILDEPTNGLDPQGIADIRNMVVRLNAETGVTVIISSHILAELEHTAHRFGIVNEGLLMKEINSADLRLKSGFTSLEIGDADVERAQKILADNNIRVNSVQKAASSLEDFYFELIGGEKDA